MKKVVFGVLFLLFLVGSIFADCRKVDQLNVNRDKDGTITSITIYYADGYCEFMQFVKDEYGEMYELERTGMAPYTEENGAVFPKD